MPERATRPALYSIPAHRGFADALVQGLVQRYSESDVGLARMTLILANNREQRAVTEAFIRYGGGMLLPRMAVVGDENLGETLGTALDILDLEEPIPPAVNAMLRRIVLADLIDRNALGFVRKMGQPAKLRLADEIAAAIDRLHVECLPFERLLDYDAGELQQHWQDSLALLHGVITGWKKWLFDHRIIDAADRRNRQLDALTRRWKLVAPRNPVIAAGITTAAPAVARVLQMISRLPRGSVVFPDLDLQMDREGWDALGATKADGEDEVGPAYSHPQWHLKLLLDRMGVAKEEVRRWHRSGLADAPAQRSRAISNLFLPPSQTHLWRTMKSADRRLSGIRLMECENRSQEARAIALAIRQALDIDGKRVALVTPDRGLATRVVAQLARWNIVADDSAGTPLSETPSGSLWLALAECVSAMLAPVELLNLCKHPQMKAGDERLVWLDGVRGMDLRLRGPRPAPGVAALKSALKIECDATLERFWESAEPLFQKLWTLSDRREISLAEAVNALGDLAEAFAPDIWKDSAGRMLSGWVDQLLDASGSKQLLFAPADIYTIFADLMQGCSVRQLWGTHSRVAVYGLLEARLQRADLMICAGLEEGTWPPAPKPDAILAPRLLKDLGLLPPEVRVGLSAHDLAGAMGAPEVLLSHVRRDDSGPTITSRFILRMKAMLGDSLVRETELPALADALDHPAEIRPEAQPKPVASPHQRTVNLSVTDLDGLLGDPYQFYARKILALRPLDPVDAEPSPRWLGTKVHDLLERWYKEDECAPAKLFDRAGNLVTDGEAHVLMRALYQPKLVSGLTWVSATVGENKLAGRTILLAEEKRTITYRGLKLTGKVDRIDRNADGSLSIVDYKTGHPPKFKQVQEGMTMQLGLLAYMAEQGAWTDEYPLAKGSVSGFEYWSLARRAKTDPPEYGYISDPALDPTTNARRTGLPRSEYVSSTIAFFDQAIDKWLLGDEPFTAKLRPDYQGYTDYDQLMRLQEWLGRDDGESLL